MKKAFTLSEALVTLAIIGVLAAILIPVINNVRPDKDKVTYKKALYSMQSAVSNALDSTVYSIAANSAAYWADDALAEDTFCKSIAESLNTSGEVKCGTGNTLPTFSCSGDSSQWRTGGSCYSDPNFMTTDGIRYWGLEGKVFNLSESGGQERTIFVDRPINENELAVIGDRREGQGIGLKIRVTYDGKIITDPEDDYENELIMDSFDLSQKR